MPKYLITGVAGTGKSTIARALKETGRNAFDIDADTDIAYSQNKATGQKEIVPDPRPEGWRANHIWVWDNTALNKVLGEHATGQVFLCGFADNQTEHLNLFDEVFVLKLDTPSLLHRLANRDSAYGKQVIERDEAVRRNPEVVASILEHGGIVIDSSLPVEHSVNEIIKIADGK